MERTAKAGILEFFMENPISNNFSHCPPKLACQAYPALEVKNAINKQDQVNPRGPGPNFTLGWRLLSYFTSQELEAQTLRTTQELGSVAFSPSPEAALLQLPLCCERPLGSPGEPWVARVQHAEGVEAVGSSSSERGQEVPPPQGPLPAPLRRPVHPARPGEQSRGHRDGLDDHRM